MIETFPTMKTTTKTTPLSWWLAVAVLALVSACSTAKSSGRGQQESYSPASQELYDAIAHADEAMSEAYNTCDVAKFEGLFAEDVEFYHDLAGLITSRQVLVDAFKNNICGKVTRELVKDSLEVYPIANYGAVELGAHYFHDKQGSDGAPSHPAKFVFVWRKQAGEWKLTRSISLH
jgi:ketosteroid isomerase-like protein